MSRVHESTGLSADPDGATDQAGDPPGQGPGQPIDPFQVLPSGGAGSLPADERDLAADVDDGGSVEGIAHDEFRDAPGPLEPLAPRDGFVVAGRSR